MKNKPPDNSLLLLLTHPPTHVCYMIHFRSEEEEKKRRPIARARVRLHYLQSELHQKPAHACFLQMHFLFLRCTHFAPQNRTPGRAGSTRRNCLIIFMSLVCGRRLMIHACFLSSPEICSMFCRVSLRFGFLLT